MWLEARAVVEAVAEAKAGLEPGVVVEAKAEYAAEAGEEAKLMPVGRVELEAKAGLAVGVGATVELRKRVMYGARVEQGDPSHEVAVVKRAEAKAKRETGALDSSPSTAVIICQEIGC